MKRIWLLAALIGIGSIPVAFGHGSTLRPISRVYSIYLENPERPVSEAGKAAVAVRGTQAFYDWHEVSLLVPDYNYRAVIPDGKLASAGRDKYAGLDLIRTDWPATQVNPGPYEVVFDGWVPHDPSFFLAYISRADWDPATPLGWDDLEPLEGPEFFFRDGNKYIFDVMLPQRTGRHVIYVIWQRIDPAGEVFFALSDVDFGDGTGYGNESDGDYSGGAGGGGGHHDHGDHGGHSPAIEGTAVFNLESDWGSGFSGEVVITNTTPYLINNWELTFTFEGTIANLWNGRISRQEGNTYTVTYDSWNSSIEGGQQRAFGFTTSTPYDPAKAPRDFVLNSVPLNGPGPTPPAEDGDNTPGHGDHGDHGEEPCNGENCECDESPEEPGHGDHGDHGTPPPAEEPELPAPPADSGSVAVSFHQDSRWGDGFTGTIRVTNNGSTPLDGWTVAFEMNGNVVNYWSATQARREGNTHLFNNESWNRVIPVGGTVTFGFQATGGTAVQPTDARLYDPAQQPGSGTPPPVEEPAQPEPEPTPPAPGNTPVDLDFTVSSDWGSGFTASAGFTNPTNTTLEGWTLLFTFPHEITQIWNAVIIERVGDTYLIGDAGYNARVAPGGSVSFGFNGGPGGGVTPPADVTLD